MSGHTYSPTEMLAKLIAFDTVSAKSNLALIDFVVDYLQAHGVESTLVHNDDKSKADLFATIGPVEANGVVLSGHSDVVPVTGQSWSADPFEMVQRDGRLYGRGTTDMKGFIAVVLAALIPMGMTMPR